MEELTTPLAEAATEYVGRWNRLISTTNWEKGRIIIEWREAMRQADAPAEELTDEAWSRYVGGVTPQHVGRLRRVFERFGEVHGQYKGLYWSHFLAALDWSDAEMYLQGAVESRWSVSEMREQRWENTGALADEKPDVENFADGDVNEDFSDSDAEQASAANAVPPTISESFDEVSGVDSSRDEDSDSAPFDAGGFSQSDEPAVAEMPRIRPFESLPPLPTDLKEAFELMKLAILSHKVSGWDEIARDDVLSVIESLRQLALAPAE